MRDVTELFPGSQGITYLNTASMALGNARAAAALKSAAEQWSAGTFDWPAAEQVGEELRSLTARLLRCAPADLSFVAGASGGASTVAAQLPDAAPGGNIVIPAGDFASNFVAWDRLQRRGYELRTVADRDGAYTLDAFAEAVDSGTAVVATSVVQSATGFRADLDGLKTLAEQHGAWLVVDASQALGAVDIDVGGLAALFSCSHKFTLGMRGIGHLWVRPDLREGFEPITPGWKATAEPMASFYGPDLALATTGARLDASWPWFNPLVDVEGMRILLDIGISAVEEHNLSLVSELAGRGVAVPFEPRFRSPIVSLTVDDDERAVASLHAAGVVASGRAGSVRVSFHLYNTAEDVDRLMEALS